MRRKDRNKAKGKKLWILRNSIKIIPKIAVQASLNSTCTLKCPVSCFLLENFLAIEQDP